MLKEKIQRLLKLQKRTLRELSEYVGMSDTGIRNIYQRNSCELSTLRKISEFFSVSIIELIVEADANFVINNNERSFNTGQKDTKTIQVLTHIIDEQRKRIDYLTDQLLKR